MEERGFIIGGNALNILVTGAKGFVGKRLVHGLKAKGYQAIMEYDKDSSPSMLEEYCTKSDFIFHLAAVNRPEDTAQYMINNYGFTRELVRVLKECQNICPVMLSSSIQAYLDNPYGASKRAEEELLSLYGIDTGAKILIYRFQNIFGGGCRPNYNSVIATFCHNIAAGLPIQVKDRNITLDLVYIDDVVEELIYALSGKGNHNAGGYYEVQPVYHNISLGSIVDILYSFQTKEKDMELQSVDELTKKLYLTYIKYLPSEQYRQDS